MENPKIKLINLALTAACTVGTVAAVVLFVLQAKAQENNAEPTPAPAAANETTPATESPPSPSEPTGSAMVPQESPPASQNLDDVPPPNNISHADLEAGISPPTEISAATGTGATPPQEGSAAPGQEPPAAAQEQPAPVQEQPAAGQEAATSPTGNIEDLPPSEAIAVPPELPLSEVVQGEPNQGAATVQPPEQSPLQAEAIAVKETEKNEIMINNGVNIIATSIDQVPVPETAATHLITYDDMIRSFKDLQLDVAKIEVAAAFRPRLRKLNVKAGTLLKKLVDKYDTDLSALSDRGDELNKEMQDIIDLLQPFSGQPISVPPDIKDQLQHQLDDFRAQVEKLRGLAGLAADVIAEETK